MDILEGQKLIKNKDYRNALNFFLNIKKKRSKKCKHFFLFRVNIF